MPFFTTISRVSYKIFSWEGETFNRGGSSPEKNCEEWLSEVQFGFFVHKFHYINEIVDILRRKVIHF